MSRGRWSATAAAAVLIAAIVTAGGASPALADTSYPSWDDVQAAKANAAASQAEVDRINGVLATLQTSANAAGDLAIKRAGEYGQAEAALQTATQKADDLRGEADAATTKAASLRSQSGKLAEQLTRSGGSELSVRLFLTGNNSVTSSQLLYQLGAVSKLADQASTLFAQATAQKNLAASLSQQAAAARTIRDRLATEAKTALDAAKAAKQAADAQLADQKQHATTLYAQLASLKNTEASVEQKYAEGVQAAQEAAAQAAAAAAAAGDGGADGFAPPPGVVVDPAGAQNYASSVLGSYGWGGDQMSCLIRLWNQESGWRTDAYNTSSGAYGIPQALPASKLASAGSDWMTNYRTQINWGLGYISGRYGSPCGAWTHEIGYNWY
ncbi:aggregation-promoting factor C-terminal-like domain-containing protein [Leifsonia lichenia]